MLANRLQNCPPGSFEQTTEAAHVAALDGIMTACVPVQNLSPAGNGIINLQAVSAPNKRSNHQRGRLPGSCSSLQPRLRHPQLQL